MPTTTNYIWDEQNYLAETDQNNVVQTVYTNEPEQYGNLVSSRISGTTSYHHFDAIGSTRQLTNAAATVTDTMIYDAWGNVVNRTGAAAAALLWVADFGYYCDAAISSFYVRARNYGPMSGRWTTIDPVAFRDHINRFVYALNSPQMFIDAPGTTSFWCCELSRPGKAPQFWTTSTFWFWQTAISACRGSAPGSLPANWQLSGNVLTATPLPCQNAMCPRPAQMAAFYIASRPVDVAGLDPYAACLAETCHAQHCDIASPSFGYIRQGYSGTETENPAYPSQRAFSPGPGDALLKRNLSCTTFLATDPRLSCADATDEDIKSCLATKPYKGKFHPTDNNCQTDVHDTAIACCLVPTKSLPAVTLRQICDNSNMSVMPF